MSDAANSVLHTPAHKTPPKCAVEHCYRPATCGIGLTFHSAMKLRLMRLLMNLDVCEQCVEELTYRNLIVPTSYFPLCEFIAQQSGVAVDVEATTVERVAWDDPEYIEMKRAAAQAAQAVQAAQAEGCELTVERREGPVGTH